jgi:hypothetical protein
MIQGVSRDAARVVRAIAALLAAAEPSPQAPAHLQPLDARLPG